MHGVPPFVAAQVPVAVALGAVAGAFDGGGTALLAAGLMFFGSAIGVLVSGFIWPGQDEPGWKLALFATFANPVMLLALLVVGLGRHCLVGRGGGIECIPILFAAGVAVTCLLSIIAGWTWHWWKRRGAASLSR